MDLFTSKSLPFSVISQISRRSPLSKPSATNFFLVHWILLRHTLFPLTLRFSLVSLRCASVSSKKSDNSFAISSPSSEKIIYPRFLLLISRRSGIFISSCVGYISLLLSLKVTNKIVPLASINAKQDESLLRPSLTPKDKIALECGGLPPLGPPGCPWPQEKRRQAAALQRRLRRQSFRGRYINHGWI